ncbi:MAG: hypothetical protein JWM16_3858 [Verrucomicrobiales bacterium]|nr:hypothetical protein [Verrucomicrobiales bacterium]
MQPIRLLKIICITAVLAGLLVPSGRTVPQVDPDTVQNIAIPYYAKGQSAPAAVVRIHRLFTDYQRRGFFRIGLLPTLVAEGVKVEVLDPTQVLAALEAAHKWLKPAAVGKALEWRYVEFVFPDAKRPRLEAAKVNPAVDGAWRLTEGVTFRSGTNETREAAAVLQVTGTRAGELQWGSAPTGSLNLLETFTDNTIR